MKKYYNPRFNCGHLSEDLRRKSNPSCSKFGIRHGSVKINGQIGSGGKGIRLNLPIPDISRLKTLGD